MPNSKESTKGKNFDSNAIEDKWYDYWTEQGFFKANEDSDKEPHVIMMPPPNVTGRLHMGHALQGTVQDSLTRMRRMQGYEALWMPGIDHAGIATQNVVEKKLKADGKNRHDLGREKFVERVWDWKEEYGSIIIDQYKKLGTSCDWDRTRFTMDKGFTKAVQTVFVELYKKELVYRGNYMVNWCPVDMTALSDEEVNNVERNGHLWYIKYQIEGTEDFITIATTRPETMLGDSAIAVNPEDDRYKNLIGKNAILPLLHRPIPIIGDGYVKIEFGAGALKVTPGHDINDFEIGKKHDLEVINMMNPDGTIAEAGGVYEGMDRFDARSKIVEDLEAKGLLEKIEDYKGTVPISSRSKAIIEPLISRQWFVKMKPMADRALEVVKSGEVKFYPQRWENEYYRWLEKIRDWTISRQLWWGHRIPVWYYLDENGEIDETRDFVVSVESPGPNMVQDEDVLDTWFSSWLWPFATLGWPEKNASLEKFYPGTVLVSGYDILFFWIARMIMAGQEFMGDVPYKDIFITGMIKDKQGRWMSKSLGNGIDPLDMIAQYGADAVRYSLIVLCAQGQDIKLDPLKFEMGRNFSNKIWNAFNVFGQFMEEGKDYNNTRAIDQLDLVERWMISRLNQTIEGVNESVSRYRLNEALIQIFEVFWHDYCDWYLELIKPPKGESMSEERLALAIEIYETMILLLHPFMPFITEELWWKMRPREHGESCMVQSWPESDESKIDSHASEAFGYIQHMVRGIRNVKNEMQILPGQKVDLVVNIDGDAMTETISQHEAYFKSLTKVGGLEIGSGLEKPPASASVIVDKHQVYMPLEGIIDFEKEKSRLQKEINQKEKFLMGVQRKLQNHGFVANAPAEVLEKEKQKEQDALAELNNFKSSLASLD